MLYRHRFLICYFHNYLLSNYQKINSFAITLRSSSEITYIDWTIEGVQYLGDLISTLEGVK